MILSDYSQLTRARQDTNIARAEGKALTELTQFFGFERPVFLPDNYWREALKVLAYGAKGTPGALFGFCEALFDVWAESTLFETTLLNGEIVKPVDLTFTCAYEQRLVRIYRENDDGFYQNYGIFFVDSINSGNLRLSETGSAYWFGVDTEATGNIQVKVMPFFIEERMPGVVKVLLDSEITTFPSHYFLEDATTARSGNGYNTFFMDYFSVVESEKESSLVNPERLGMFLGSDRVEGIFLDTLEKMLVSGVSAEIFSHSWCEESLGFNNVNTLLLTGRPQGDITWPTVGSYDSLEAREDVAP